MRYFATQDDEGGAGAGLVTPSTMHTLFTKRQSAIPITIAIKNPESRINIHLYKI
jgi:hypothetical protein